LSGSQPLHSSRPNSPSGSGSQPSSKSGSQHLYSSRTNSPSGSQNLFGSGSQPENPSRTNSTSGSQNLYRCSGTLPPLTHPPLRAPHHRANSPTCFHPISGEMLHRLKPPCQSPGCCPADVFLTPVKTSPGNLIVIKMTHSHSVLRRQLTSKTTSLYPKSR
jgi:hypothetical protein